MSNPSTNQPTSPTTSPPFDSPGQSLNNNSYFRINDNDRRFSGSQSSDLHGLSQGFHLPHLPLNQSGSYMGSPLHGLSNFNHIGNINSYHQHSSSFPSSLSQHSLPNFAPGTVNPQLISSPPVETSWNQNSFLPSSHGSVQSPFLRPGRLLAQAASSNSTRLPASVQSYASLYTSLDGPFDHISQPTEQASAVPSHSSGRVFKAESKTPSISEDFSNDTSLLPESSSSFSLLSAPKSKTKQASDGSEKVSAQGSRSKAARQPVPRRAAVKRRRLSDLDLSEDEDDSEDEEGRSGGVKFHKACSNCRKQKGKCVKRETDDKCRMCRTRNLTCVFEPRPERKQPIQRKVLMEQLRKKDAIIESFRQMLKPHMLHLHSGSENNPSSGSPPSSAAHEEPLRKQVLEWLDKADASKVSSGPFNLDSRAFNDSSSDDNDGPQEDSAASSLSRPRLQHQHSHGYSNSSGVSGNHVDLTRSRSRSPRVTRNSAIAIHPVGLLARASLRGSGMGSRPSSAGEPLTSSASLAEIGVARHDYFVSGDSMAQRASQLGLRRIEIDRGLSEEPKLLRKGLIVPDEVDKLFEIFYDKLNVAVSLLDPVLHTPATTFARCPLLFTVVCAVASRYYTERPELYSIAMHFAMTSAASSLMEAKKSVELCQAYLLLSVWPLPSRKYDEDRAWLYLGLAIRMAMDLNLHLPTNIDVVSEQQEREILNRTRTWIICFNMDRSSSAQLGKPMTIRENFMIRTSFDWYKRSKFNHPYDLHLCQLTSLMRIMSRFQETVYADISNSSGVKEDLDLRKTAFEFDDEIVLWERGAAALFAAESDPNDPGCRYRCHLLPFYVNYSRLVILSFGFQYAFRRAILSPDDDLVTRCVEAAQNVINKMVNDLAARPYLRYAPDGHLVFASFASAFLLKLLRQKFVHLISETKRLTIIPLVERLIRVLSDPSVAVEEFHTPKIYARFLTGLLQKHRIHSRVQHIGQDQDTDMQEHQSTGLTINLNMVHQSNNGVFGPLSPSIQVTPPPTDMSFEFLLRGSKEQDELGDDSQGNMAMSGYELPLESSAAPSGSGTVHPLDEIAREEDDEDLLLPLRAINDPGPFWGHAMVPWPEVSMPAGSWDRDLDHHPFLSNLDG